jgi:prepilin-type N-terminal cleavage/methylation domain-containing protein/prepilin-type processing-associated H-X9-DG protein
LAEKGGKAAMRQKDRAFTLVELLVVIGIIAVLIALLLPAVNRSREQANQVACLSNLRQLSMAMILYCQDNDGWFPRAAPYAAAGQPESPQDYIWWQQDAKPYAVPDRDIFQSPILKYLGFKLDSRSVPTVIDFNESRQRVLRCPSDPLSDHSNLTTSGSYYYSYTLNNLMQSLDPNIKTDGLYLPIDRTTGTQFPVAGKLVKVRNPAEKILLVDEAEGTVEDGSFDPTDGKRLLSVRHDHTAKAPPDSPTGYVKIGGVWSIWNGNCKGNVSFCDGHADYVTRAYVDDPQYEVDGDNVHWDWAR